MMKFLANENFPFPSINLLRSCHFYVLSVAEEFPGISDAEVIKIALEKELIILTFDKDYGEIIFKFGFAKPPAVVFFRYKGALQTFAGKYIVSLLEKERGQLDAAFTVIEENNYRQRKYNR